MRTERLTLAFIVSALLSVIVSFLSNLLADTVLDLSPFIQPWMVLLLLIITFVISLPPSLFVLHSQQPAQQPLKEAKPSPTPTPVPPSLARPTRPISPKPVVSDLVIVALALVISIACVSLFTSGFIALIAAVYYIIAYAISYAILQLARQIVVAVIIIGSALILVLIGLTFIVLAAPPLAEQFRVFLIAPPAVEVEPIAPTPERTPVPTWTLSFKLTDTPLAPSFAQRREPVEPLTSQSYSPPR